MEKGTVTTISTLLDIFAKYLEMRNVSFSRFLSYAIQISRVGELWCKYFV